jgi:hypothetical protein
MDFWNKFTVKLNSDYSRRNYLTMCGYSAGSANVLSTLSGVPRFSQNSDKMPGFVAYSLHSTRNRLNLEPKLIKISDFNYLLGWFLFSQNHHLDSKWSAHLEFLRSKKREVCAFQGQQVLLDTFVMRCNFPAQFRWSCMHCCLEIQANIYELHRKFHILDYLQ